jgi:hypothetical protein
LFSAPVFSVSMSLVLRDSKTLQVNTAFGGSLAAADVWTGSLDFLASARYYCRRASCISLLPGSQLGLLIPLRFCSCTALSCLCAHLQGALQFIQCYRVHAVNI